MGTAKGQSCQAWAVCQGLELLGLLVTSCISSAVAAILVFIMPEKLMARMLTAPKLG